MGGFTERGGAERGFSEVYRREIVPILDRYETERREVSGAAKKWMAVAVLGGVGLAAALFAFGVWNIAIFAGIAGVFGAFAVHGQHQKRWQTGLSAEVMPIACRFLGDLDYGSQRLSAGEFSALGIVPSHSRASLEDPVSGTHQGLGFAMTEARLTQRRSSGKGGSRTVTVFRGLLIRIELAAEAPTIYFRRDRGSVGNWFADLFAGSSRTKIEIEDPDFEATYETWAEDPGAARAFITPRLTDGLMEVARSEAGGTFVAAAVSGRYLRLALPRRDDFLTIGSLFSPLHVPERDFHELLDDLTLPRRVIDAFRGR